MASGWPWGAAPPPCRSPRRSPEGRQAMGQKNQLKSCQGCRHQRGAWTPSRGRGSGLGVPVSDPGHSCGPHGDSGDGGGCGGARVPWGAPGCAFPVHEQCSVCSLLPESRHYFPFMALSEAGAASRRAPPSRPAGSTWIPAFPIHPERSRRCVRHTGAPQGATSRVLTLRVTPPRFLPPRDPGRGRGGDEALQEFPFSMRQERGRRVWRRRFAPSPALVGRRCSPSSRDGDAAWGQWHCPGNGDTLQG